MNPILPDGLHLKKGGNMQCVICHGSQIETKKINEEVQVENDVVFIPVEVMVCKTCGERYYDRKTKRYLEETTQEIRKGSAHLHEIGKVSMLAA
jgi:YgiT-type zinc finger domain-containing protein